MTIDRPATPKPATVPVTKSKVVFIMGATATGKSKLSIDIATHLQRCSSGAEIINSDKIQVYEGLNILTNKVTKEEMKGVSHHLLGHVSNPDEDYPPDRFAREVLETLDVILKAGRLPIIVGGSNAYIEALVTGPVSGTTFMDKFDCCFIWVNVDVPVLHAYVDRRVDKMVEMGMFEEVKELYGSFWPVNFSRGIYRSIGVPEFERYFKEEKNLGEEEKMNMLAEVIEEVKENTRKLTLRQLSKIRRLEDLGWDIHMIDATKVLQQKTSKEALSEWDGAVLKPALDIVKACLERR